MDIDINIDVDVDVEEDVAIDKSFGCSGSLSRG